MEGPSTHLGETVLMRHWGRCQTAERMEERGIANMLVQDREARDWPCPEEMLD